MSERNERVGLPERVSKRERIRVLERQVEWLRKKINDLKVEEISHCLKPGERVETMRDRKGEVIGWSILKDSRDREPGGSAGSDCSE